MDTKQENLRKSLSEHAIPFQTGISLRGYSWFKSGGNVDTLILPETVGQIETAVNVLSESGLPYKVIGETSNLLFLDDRCYSCLLCTKAVNRSYLSEDGSSLVAETGALLPEVARHALLESIDGFAGLEGIPGTIGGAVFMNAGAFNYSIDQVLQKVDIVHLDGRLETLPSSALELEHRNSIFRKGGHTGIVLRAYFKVTKGDQHTIYSNMSLYHSKRHKYLEYMYPNLGSMFVGSVYRAFAAKDLYYKIVSGIYILFNYKYKIFRRESPIDRKWLNDFTVKRFGIRFNRQPFSDKTLNMLINNSHHTDEILDYIDQIKGHVGENLQIENEIVDPF